MALKLITEATFNDVKVLTEGKDPANRAYFIEGIFLQGNTKNHNGRIYPSDILEREIERYTKEHIAENRAFGELGHPSTPTINLDRVSHMIKNIARDGDTFTGKAKITQNLPMGQIVKGLIDEGAKLGVSSRGLGSLRETSTGMVVGNDFYFSTVDIVADPSAPNAFVQGIMEGREWVWDNGILREAAVSEIAKEVAAAHNPHVGQDERNRKLVESFERYMQALKTGVASKTIIR